MPYSLANHYNSMHTEGHVQLQEFLANYHPVLSSKAASFPLTPTEPEVHHNVIFRHQLKSDWKLMYRFRMNGRVIFGDCKPWFVIRDYGHNRNCPSSAVQI